MGIWRKFRSVFGFHAETPRTLPVDPLALAYVDALAIANAIYTGQPWSRRAFARRMSQPRWQAATDLLRDVDLLDNRGRFLWESAPNQEMAEVLVREAVNRQRAMRRHKNFVPPR